MLRTRTARQSSSASARAWLWSRHRHVCSPTAPAETTLTAASPCHVTRTPRDRVLLAWRGGRPPSSTRRRQGRKEGGCKQAVRLVSGRWPVLVCFERKLLLIGC
jgi:hypothetical protein